MLNLLGKTVNSVLGILDIFSNGTCECNQTVNKTDINYNKNNCWSEKSTICFQTLWNESVLLLFPETILAPISLRSDHSVTMSRDADKVIWRWHDWGLGHKVVIQIREGSCENAVMEHISVHSVYGIKLKETHKITNHLLNSWDLLHFILSHMLLPCAFLCYFSVFISMMSEHHWICHCRLFLSVDSLRLSDIYASVNYIIIEILLIGP